MKFKKVYTGVLGDQFGTMPFDQYQVNLEKGKKYKIQLKIDKSKKKNLTVSANIVHGGIRGGTVYEYKKLPTAGESLINKGSVIIKADSSGSYLINIMYSADGEQMKKLINNSGVGIQYTLKVSPVK